MDQTWGVPMWCLSTLGLVVYGSLIFVGGAFGGAVVLLACKTMAWSSSEVNGRPTGGLRGR